MTGSILADMSDAATLIFGIPASVRKVDALAAGRLP